MDDDGWRRRSAMSRRRSISSAPFDPGRPVSELKDTGLLWLINKAVFHPRGFALALHFSAPGPDGTKAVTGWSLQGDGSEAWTMGPDIDEDALLAKVRELLGP